MTIARPVPGPAAAYHFPRFGRSSLDNGVRILHAAVHRVPLVTVAVLLDNGAAAERADQRGVAAMSAAMLLEGTTGKSADEIVDAFEQLGASIDAAADWDATIVKLTVRSDRLETALSLLGEILLAPAFSERGFARVKAERLAAIEQIRADPGALAEEAVSRFVYSPGARYSGPVGGTSEDVERIGIGDIREFHARTCVPERATFVIVGDVSAELARSLVAGTFERWRSVSGESVPNPTPPDEVIASGRKVHVIRKPDAPQSEVRIAHRGLPRSHPDYFPVVVMNSLLGGLFSSRINLNLRERHGYTYGASSYFDWRRDSGPFVISTAVQSDVTSKAVAETLKEMDLMRSDRVMGDELSLATSYLAGVFPLRYETTASIASALANLAVFGLDDGYYDTYRDNILAVTADDVLEAARKHLDDSSMQLVIVGDAEALLPQLEQLQAGQLTVHAPNEVI